jgi:hypothetical protein
MHAGACLSIGGAFLWHAVRTICAHVRQSKTARIRMKSFD